ASTRTTGSRRRSTRAAARGTAGRSTAGTGAGRRNLGSWPWSPGGRVGGREPGPYSPRPAIGGRGRRIPSEGPAGIAPTGILARSRGAIGGRGRGSPGATRMPSRSVYYVRLNILEYKTNTRSQASSGLSDGVAAGISTTILYS